MHPRNSASRKIPGVLVFVALAVVACRAQLVVPCSDVQAMMKPYCCGTKSNYDYAPAAPSLEQAFAMGNDTLTAVCLTNTTLYLQNYVSGACAQLSLSYAALNCMFPPSTNCTQLLVAAVNAVLPPYQAVLALVPSGTRTLCYQQGVVCVGAADALCLSLAWMPACTPPSPVPAQQVVGLTLDLAYCVPPSLAPVAQLPALAGLTLANGLLAPASNATAWPQPPPLPATLQWLSLYNIQPDPALASPGVLALWLVQTAGPPWPFANTSFPAALAVGLELPGTALQLDSYLAFPPQLQTLVLAAQCLAQALPPDLFLQRPFVQTLAVLLQPACATQPFAASGNLVSQCGTATLLHTLVLQNPGNISDFSDVTNCQALELVQITGADVDSSLGLVAWAPTLASLTLELGTYTPTTLLSTLSLSPGVLTTLRLSGPFSGEVPDWMCTIDCSIQAEGVCAPFAGCCGVSAVCKYAY